MLSLHSTSNFQQFTPPKLVVETDLPHTNNTRCDHYGRVGAKINLICRAETTTVLMIHQKPYIQRMSNHPIEAPQLLQLQRQSKTEEEAGRRRLELGDRTTSVFCRGNHESLHLWSEENDWNRRLWSVYILLFFLPIWCCSWRRKQRGSYLK